MDKFNILDCTLRDGGYINNWEFGSDAIREIICELTEAEIDFIEVGYLNTKAGEENSTQFKSVGEIADYIPEDRKNSSFLAMADVEQFSGNDLEEYTGRSIDGIRVVFYKHQVDKALALSRAIVAKGYKLFVQPMVTIDYSLDEYAHLVKEIERLKPYAVSIVDSFGYMLQEDFRKYFRILDNILQPDVIVGFHSHNNMNLAFITAQDIITYHTSRKIVIDSSLYGMGRGAGNLNTELIVNYYNMTLGKKYDVSRILNLIGKYIMPIYRNRAWGYSPYLFITGLYHYHPNFACYLLDEHEVGVSEFAEFIHTIPDEMRTKCKKPYVLEMWEKYKRG